MTESLKCPECSAPLDPPSQGSQTLRCPYCHSTVLLKDSYDGPLSGTTRAGLATINRKTIEISKLNDLLRAGNKIEAIRIYRQQHKVDLPTAMAFVNQLAAGHQINSRVTTVPEKRTPSASIAAIALFAVGVMIACLITARLLVPFRSSPAPKLLSSYVPPLIEDRPASPLAPPPTPPTFANQVAEFGSEGIGAGQFKDARSIAIDGLGHVYVGEYCGGRIQVFDKDGKFLKIWSIDSKNCLSNLAANREGTLIAVIPGRILCFEGMTGRAFGEAATINGDTQENYMDACFSLSGDIYSIDTDSNIVILDGAGQIKRTIKAKQNTGDDEVRFDKITVNGNGQIYTIDHKKGIFQFAADGRYINRFGMSDDPDPMDRRPDTLHEGFNLAIDGRGRVFVSDLNAAIKVFDGDGRFIDTFGNNDVCFGLAIDDQNQILGCFRNEHVVRKFAIVKK